MKISTRGRYALRVMIDLAENDNGRYIPLKEICERQEISQKYLESIVAELSKAGLVLALHGKGGGYRLAKAPNEYTVAEILRVEEGDLAPIECLAFNAKPCVRADNCRTLPMWQGLYKVITEYLEGISLADLAKLPVIDNWVI